MGTAFLYGNGGSGGTGATLTITAPAGCTVTISRDGKTKTKTAGADGLAVFKGLATGEWTVTIKDGGQTASKVVTVTADYAVSITFFSATINVTYPAGSVCTATDGVTTLSAPDTSGTWECVVHNAGTWTVKAKTTGGEKEKTSDVVITNSGQIESITIVYQQILYHQGNEYTDITGGWIGSTTPHDEETSVIKAYAPSIDRTDSALIATVPLNSDYCYTGAIRTNNKVGIAGYSMLHMEVEITASYSGAISEKFYLFADSTGSEVFSASSCASKVYNWTYGAATKQLTMECDVSYISEYCYVGLHYRFAHDFGLTAKITKVWLD